MQNIESITKDLYNFSQKFLGFDRPATIAFESHGDKARNVFAPTGNYNPTTRTITIFVDHRHPKDILRSLAHELVHHGQNCRGEFKRDMATILGYAQNNPHMREMEIEAYKNGNIMLFRDWEDNYKQRSHQMIKENKNVIEAVAARTMKNIQEMLQQESKEIEENTVQPVEEVTEDTDIELDETQKTVGDIAPPGIKDVKGEPEPRPKVKEETEETLEETEEPQELKESRDSWRNRMLYEMTFNKFLPKKK